MDSRGGSSFAHGGARAVMSVASLRGRLRDGWLVEGVLSPVIAWLMTEEIHGYY